MELDAAVGSGREVFGRARSGVFRDGIGDMDVAGATAAAADDDADGGGRLVEAVGCLLLIA